MTHVHKSFAEMTHEVIITFLTHNQIDIAEVPDLIRNVHQVMQETVGKQTGTSEPISLVDHTHQEEVTLRGNGARASIDIITRRPAVPVEKSVTGDYIFCLECGKRFKTMKHHLQLEHDMTPEEYRIEWGLKPDYPVTAPNHSENRRKIAKKAGLGNRITGR